jgi:hypothetical protein
MIFAAATGLQKVQSVPTDVWIKVGIGILAFIVAVFLLRKLAHVNIGILIAVTFIVLTVGGFKWIYERDEPAFLTPVIDRIAPFFPSKGAYGNKQQKLPDEKDKKKASPTPVRR